jgi:hypothetical protein
VVFCENETFIATIDKSAKTNLNELVLKRVFPLVNNLISLGDVAVVSIDGVINLCSLDGPAFGTEYK